MDALLESFNSTERRVQRKLKWKALMADILYKQFKSPNQEDIPIKSLGSFRMYKSSNSFLKTSTDEKSTSIRAVKRHIFLKRLQKNKQKKEGLINDIGTPLGRESIPIRPSTTPGIRKYQPYVKILKSQAANVDIANFLKHNFKHKHSNDNSTSISDNGSCTPKKIQPITNLEENIRKGAEENIVSTKTIAKNFNRNCALLLYKNKRMGTHTFLKKLLKKILFVENSVLFINDEIEISLSRTEKRLIRSYSSNICGMDYYKLLRIVNFIKKNNPQLTEYLLGMKVLDRIESVEQYQNDKYSRLSSCITKEILEISKVMSKNHFEAYTDYTLWLSEQKQI